MPADAVFEIGSITKTFTGRCSRTWRARAWSRSTIRSPSTCPVAPPVLGRPITLEDLATHTSGLPRLPTGMLRTAYTRDRKDPYAQLDLRAAIPATRAEARARRPRRLLELRHGPARLRARPPRGHDLRRARPRAHHRPARPHAHRARHARPRPGPHPLRPPDPALEPRRPRRRRRPALHRRRPARVTSRSTRASDIPLAEVRARSPPPAREARRRRRRPRLARHPRAQGHLPALPARRRPPRRRHRRLPHVRRRHAGHRHAVVVLANQARAPARLGVKGVLRAL